MKYRHGAIVSALTLGLLFLCLPNHRSRTLLASHHVGVGLSISRFTQENSSLTAGTGVQAHWNLTSLISSAANAFDSTAADVDGDGEPEIIVSRNSQCEFYCLKQDGTVLWHTPVLSTHTPGYYGGQVVDIDQDGHQEYVAAADSIWVLDAATGRERWSVAEIGGDPDEAPWMLGHVSSTENWDIVTARADGSTFVVSVYNWNGDLVWQTPISDATYGHTISLRDVDHDGYDEIFVPCSKRTVALDHDGRFMWAAPLTPVVTTTLTADFMRVHRLAPSTRVTDVEGWWYHSDFAVVTPLYNNERYYVLHDYGGGVLDPTIVQVLDALTGGVVDEFESHGHHQWLQAADLRTDRPGEEIVYVTREEVVMCDSSLQVLWTRSLSGAHEIGLGDWDGDGTDDIIVSTVFREIERTANLDSDFVVYDVYGSVVYSMLYRYPDSVGRYTAVQMQGAMLQIRDHNSDGRVDIPVCFSSHDLDKFGSSQDVHQYIMGLTDVSYSSEFHTTGNRDSTTLTRTVFLDDGLQLGYVVPTEEYAADESVVLLMHMNDTGGSTVEDASAYNNDGILYNAAWTDQGLFGQAVQFAYPGDVIWVPLSSSLIFDNVTLEAWLQVTPSDGTQTLIEKPGAFWLQITKDGLLSFYVHDPAAAPHYTLPHVEAPFTDFGHFAHVAASYDGCYLRLIVNGTEVARTSHSGTINRSTGRLHVGNNVHRTQPTQGVIDEVRISNRARAFPRSTSGEWVSNVLFPPGSYDGYGSLKLAHTLNGGQVTYDVLGQNNHPLPGHTNLTSSEHTLVDLNEPIRVRVSITRGVTNTLSPVVEHILVTRRDIVVSPAQTHWISTTAPIFYEHTVESLTPGSTAVSFAASAPLGWSVDVSPSVTTVLPGQVVALQVAVCMPTIMQTHQNYVVITTTSSLSAARVVVKDSVRTLGPLYLPFVLQDSEVALVHRSR